MTLDQIRRMACGCVGPEYHQTGNARCAISILLAVVEENKDHCAELAADVNDTTVVPADQLPHDVDHDFPDTRTLIERISGCGDLSDRELVIGQKIIAWADAKLLDVVAAKVSQ